MTRSAQLGRAVLSCFLLVLNAPALERAPSEPVASPPTVGHSFVIRAKAVYPVTVEQPGPIERGMIVVRNGRIEAVGRLQCHNFIIIQNLSCNTLTGWNIFAEIIVILQQLGKFVPGGALVF